LAPPYFCLDSQDCYAKVGRWALDQSHHSSRWVADETIAFLQKNSLDEDPRPFFLSVNFQDPHVPFLVPEPWDELHRDVELPLPIRQIDERERNRTTLYRATVERRLGELGWNGRAFVPCQTSLGIGDSTERTAEESAKWRAYMGMQSLLDHHLGRILDELDRLQLAEDTLVVYTSDHGDYMGDHWLWSKGGSHYDQAVRVPFIVRWPGRVGSGQSSGNLQSLVDLAPTFLSAAGVQVPGSMQGSDQLASWLGTAPSPRKGVLIDHRVERGIYVSTWITATHRLSIHSIVAEGRDEIELYDLAKDPGELRNISDEPGSDALVRQLMTEMIHYRMASDRDWLPRDAHA
jgi:arylsulfatase A-like enzyme